MQNRRNTHCRSVVWPVGATAFVCSMVFGCRSPSGDSRIDAGEPLPLYCEEIAQEWIEQIEGVDRSCTTVDDCALVGAVDRYNPCHCQPTVSMNCGRAVNRRAYEGSRAARLEAEFLDRNCDRPAICDCTQPNARCNGYCHIEFVGSCFADQDAGPDTGVPDAGR